MGSGVAAALAPRRSRHHEETPSRLGAVAVVVEGRRASARRLIRLDEVASEVGSTRPGASARRPADRARGAEPAAAQVAPSGTAVSGVGAHDVAAPIAPGRHVTSTLHAIGSKASHAHAAVWPRTSPLWVSSSSRKRVAASAPSRAMAAATI